MEYQKNSGMIKQQLSTYINKHLDELLMQTVLGYIKKRADNGETIGNMKAYLLGDEPESVAWRQDFKSTITLPKELAHALDKNTMKSIKENWEQMSKRKYGGNVLAMAEIEPSSFSFKSLLNFKNQHFDFSGTHQINFVALANLIEKCSISMEKDEILSRIQKNREQVQPKIKTL